MKSNSVQFFLGHPVVFLSNEAGFLIIATIQNKRFEIKEHSLIFSFFPVIDRPSSPVFLTQRTPSSQGDIAEESAGIFSSHTAEVNRKAIPLIFEIISGVCLSL